MSRDRVEVEVDLEVEKDKEKKKDKTKKLADNSCAKSNQTEDSPENHRGDEDEIDSELTRPISLN